LFALATEADVFEMGSKLRADGPKTQKRGEMKRQNRVNPRTKKAVAAILKVLSYEHFTTKKVLIEDSETSLESVDACMGFLVTREEAEAIKVKINPGKGRAQVAFRLL